MQTDLIMDNLSRLEAELNHLTVDRVTLRQQLENHELNEQYRVLPER